MKKLVTIMLSVLLAFSVMFIGACEEPHSHQAELISAKDATCTEAGNTAYYKCSGCGKYFSDEACTTEIAENSWVVAAKGHTGVLQQGKAASEQDGWNNYYKCSVCGKCFEDSACTTEITDLEAWKTGAGKINALNKLATPILSASAEGITWASVENAVKYQAKVDNGEYADATSCAFVTTVGQHTVTVKAIADGTNYIDSDGATYSYEVKNASISYEKTSATQATISSYVGGALKLVMGTGDIDFPYSLPYAYTATESGSLTVKATGKWDAENKILYLEKSETVNFVVNATSEKVIEDADGKTAADLTDVWTIKKYDGGWKDCEATIGIGSYNNSQCVVANCWHHYTNFKYSTSYSANEGYNVLSFDMKGDGVNVVKVQIANSTSGIYATYSLGTLPAYWQHFEVSMADEAWKINYNGTDYTFAQAIGYIGMAEVNEVLQYCDTISFLFYGEDSNWSSCKMYFDNVKFVCAETPATVVSQPLFNTSLLYTASNSNNVVFKFQLKSAGSGTLSSLNLQENISAPVTFEISNDGVVTIKDSLGGAGITLVGQFIDNGAKFIVKEATGNYKDNFPVGMTFGKVTTIDNFNYYSETGTGIDGNNTDVTQVGGLRASYFGEYYDGSSTSPLSGNGWKLIGATDYITLDTSNGIDSSKAMKIRAFNGGAVKYITMANVCGKISNGAIPSFAISYGSATTFSMWVKAADSKDITIKVALIYQSALEGNAVNELSWNQISLKAGSGWNHIELPASKEVYGYAIIVNANWSGDYYLLVDNVELYDANPYAEYVAPEINLDDYSALTVNEDFSSYTPSSGGATSAGAEFSKIYDIYVRNDSGAGYGDSKYMTAMYANTGSVRSNTVTYTPATAGLANKVAIAVGNNRNTNALAITVVLKVYDVNGNVVLEESFDVAKDADWELKSFTFEKTAVKKMTVTISTTATPVGNAFAKLDNLTLCVEEGGQQQNKANLTLDFEDGAGSGNYTNSAWTQYKWNNSAYEATSGKMNSRVVGDSKIVNMYGGWTTYKFVYNENGSSLGLANTLSVSLGNWYNNSGAIKIRIVVVDVNGNKQYLAGSASSFESFALTGSNTLVSLSKTFNEAEIKSIEFYVRYETGDNYLYMDNVSLSYQTAE